MSVVSNTGPLIALAKIDQLGLLERLFGQVHIPPAVERELFAKAGVESTRLSAALGTFIRVTSPQALTTEVQAATSYIDHGEQQAVALAHELGLLLVIDDRQGRQAARHLQLLHTGVAGILIQAKQAGLLPLVRPVLEEIRTRGYWLSDELIKWAAMQAGEIEGPEHSIRVSYHGILVGKVSSSSTSN